MAEPGNETIAQPPPSPPPSPPPETETMDGGPVATETTDSAPRTTSDSASQVAPAAMSEPFEGNTTPPPQEAEPTDGVASALDDDPALPTDEPARPAPPQEQPPDAAAAGQTQQTATEATSQPPPMPTKAEEVIATPPTSETPPPPPPLQEMVATTKVEAAEKQLPATAPPLQQQQQEGGAATEEASSSVHEEEKDAAPARAQEGEEKPEKKHAAGVQEGRRRWRQLQAAVRLIFLRCKIGDRSSPQSPLPEDKGGEAKQTAPGGTQPVSGLEETKPAMVDEGEMKPAAPADNQPASGQEKLAAVPPPPETPSQKTAATAADAQKPLAAPPTQQPPHQKQEGGHPEQASSSVQEEEKDAAPSMAQEGEENAARRRWRWLRAAVHLLFLHPKPEDNEGKQPVSELEDKKTTPAEKLQGKESASEVKPSAPDAEDPAPGQKVEKPAIEPAPQPQRKDSIGGILDKPEMNQKDEGQRSKGRHDEIQAGDEAVPDGSPAAKTKALVRLQKAGKLLLRLMSWYKRHRTSGTEEGGKRDEIETKPATAQDGDKGADDGTKPAPAPVPVPGDGKQPASGQEKKPPHPKWRREEERLEKILEDAFTRLLASEFHQLRPIRKKCLLTFSVFDLAAEVKKQVMVYWWVSEFNLKLRLSDQSTTDAAAPPAEIRKRCKFCKNLRRARKPAADPAGAGNNSPAPQGKSDEGRGNHDDEAEGIFSELCSYGFLEPARNWCSKVIHGCKVNPLVHWMVKRRARDDSFADLEVNGKPADLQRSSSILCLTAGNRRMLQKMRMDDESPQQPDTRRTTTSTSVQSSTQEKVPDQGQKNTQTMLDQLDDISPSFKGKRVILNVNAHVYPVSKSMFSDLADYLVVLQLGRWCNLDDKTYMEVDGLESMDEIGLLKNLRYLSLRGLSRLTKLPKGIQWLKKLEILDMRGCQNLVNVKITTPLKQLTHLDLTECYMLEHIDRGITSLSELQVFKGFVFATGTQGNKACRVQDLRRLKKLQKLTISIATEANVGKGDMSDLKHLTSLHKLTITWSEIPRILDGDSDTMKEKRERLLEKWTSFDVPQNLLKLDLRCYPKKELNLKVHKNLKKLYLRGGELEKFSIDEPKSTNSSDKTNCITTLRLRYLKNFNMDWEEIRSVLMDIEYVEIVPKDENLMKDVDNDQKDNNTDTKDQKVDVDKDKKDKNINIKDQDKNIDIKDQKNIGEGHKPMENIQIGDQKDKNIAMKDQQDIEAKRKLVMKKRRLYSVLDENGVWVKDNMEEANLLRLNALGAKEKSKGPIEDSSGGGTSIIADNNNHQNDISVKEQSGQRKIDNNP